MHPKNTTTIESPQGQEHMLDPESATTLLFTPGQRAVVIGLLKAERSHASRWWIFLNEARCRGELPAWIVEQQVGRHADYDLWESDTARTNRLLLGIAGHLNGFNQNQLVGDSSGTFHSRDPESRATQSNQPFCGAQGGRP